MNYVSGWSRTIYALLPPLGEEVQLQLSMWNKKVCTEEDADEE